MSTRNQLGNCTNPFQGKYKKVLCICAGGLLRSPTAAFVLSKNPYNYNTRAAGLETDFALVPVTEVLLAWADEIVCMDDYQAKELKSMTEKPVYSLSIPDNYSYRDPQLIKLIKKNYEKVKKEAETK